MSGQTPSQTVGPFFHPGLVRPGQEVLVDEQTRGQRIVIEGTVSDGAGAPVPDAVLGIWQADASGVYDHPADPRRAQVDPHFAGFGRAPTGDDGRYRFKTVKPDGFIQKPYQMTSLREKIRAVLAADRIP